MSGVAGRLARRTAGPLAVLAVLVALLPLATVRAEAGNMGTSTSAGTSTGTSTGAGTGTDPAAGAATAATPSTAEPTPGPTTETDRPAENPLRHRASLDLWLHGAALQASAPAVLPTQRAVLDLRPRLQAEAGPWVLDLEPRLTRQALRLQGQTVEGPTRATLSQGFVRWQQDRHTLVAGRERWTWGPANYRSPSHPFYFDAGRTDPLALTPGADLVRMTVDGLAADPSLRLTTAVVSAGHSATDGSRAPAGAANRLLVAKLDQTGDQHLASLILALPAGGTAHRGTVAGSPASGSAGTGTGNGNTPAGQRSAFLGGFIQFTPDDAWLLYAEAGAASRPLDAGHRRAALLGASYTREGGDSLLIEWLQRDGRRQHLWAGWHGNPQETRLQWRAELSLNTVDGSGQALLYAERTLAPRLSAFAAASRQWGGPGREYGGPLRSQLTAGLKWFAW